MYKQNGTYIIPLYVSLSDNIFRFSKHSISLYEYGYGDIMDIIYVMYTMK
jgi:hypothetical protein